MSELHGLVFGVEHCDMVRRHTLDAEALCEKYKQAIDTWFRDNFPRHVLVIHFGREDLVIKINGLDFGREKPYFPRTLARRWRLPSLAPLAPILSRMSELIRHYPEMSVPSLVSGHVRWVNVYNVTRAYGGPEEGGWWYDEGELVESHRCGDEQRAEVLAQKISRESCHAFDVRVETGRGGSFPMSRPHYE